MPGPSKSFEELREAVDRSMVARTTAAMLAAALAVTGKISATYPQSVTDTVKAIGSSGKEWLQEGGLPGEVFRAFVGDLVALVAEVDAERAQE